MAFIEIRNTSAITGERKVTRANVLVLGGTQFVGRHIVQALLKAGHFVSILNRGKSPDELPGEVERLRGDRDVGLPGLQAIRGRSWDACVDVSGYTARQVRPSAETLRERVTHYVFISAISVYGDPQDRPVRETHSRVSPVGEDVTEVDGETYARLKVACEDIVEGIYANRCTLLRPQIVAGPFDLRDRYSYWLRRVEQGGDMLAPGDGSDHLQVIDARDVARFVCTVIENALTGPFNLAGPRFTWAEFMKIMGARNVIWVAAEVIKALGVTEFELPLFRPENGLRAGLMDVSNERAVGAGLTLTAPRDTIAYTVAWVRGASLSPALSPQREVELISRAR
jgi:2'-hydroxyisoflavone reductase